jgi:hypothetical protein
MGPKNQAGRITDVGDALREAAVVGIIRPQHLQLPVGTTLYIIFLTGWQTPQNPTAGLSGANLQPAAAGVDPITVI